MIDYRQVPDIAFRSSAHAGRNDIFFDNTGGIIADAGNSISCVARQRSFNAHSGQ